MSSSGPLVSTQSGESRPSSKYKFKQDRGLVPRKGLHIERPFFMQIDQIVADAMEEIGALAAGEEAKAEELDFGRRKLHRLLRRWENDPTISTGSKLVDFQVSNKMIHTMGPGGDFDIPEAPARIRQAFYRNADVDYNLKMTTGEDYARISTKGIVSGIPYNVWVDRSYPLRMVRFYPLPTVGRVFFLINNPFPNVITEKNLDLSADYLDFIILHLGIELCPSFEREPTARLLQSAQMAKESVMDSNTSSDPIFVTDDVGGNDRGSYNWETGY